MTDSGTGALSRHDARFIRDALAIQDADPRDTHNLGYTARILTIATLPHRAQPGDHFERRNGGYRLIVQAMPGAGLPFGSYPRLLLAWLATEIVRTRQRELVLGASMADFMRQLGLGRSGGRAAHSRSAGTIHRLKRQIVSLFGSRLILHGQSARRGEHIELLQIGDGFEFWADPAQPDVLPGTLRVSEPLYEHILRAPVPVDLRALRALKRSPLALDVYTWLTHRNFVQQNGGRKQAIVPWGALQRQFGSDYPLDSRGRADFKKAFHGAYRRVQLVYPRATIRDDGDCLTLITTAPHVRTQHLICIR
jgi:hypothetical protein